MSRPFRRLRRVFRELKRRRVWRVAAVYAVVGWLVIQVAAAIFPLLFLPEWMARAVVVLVLLGFPVALVLAWAFERTPEGLQRTGSDRGARASGELEDASAPGTSASTGASVFGAHPRRAVLILFGAGLVVAAAAYWAVAGFQGFPEGRAGDLSGEAEGTPRVARLDLSLGRLERPTNEDVVISLDGSMLVVAARAADGDETALYLRRLSDDASFARIPGTEGAQTPAFSPDSRWIVYRKDGDLLRVAPDGGGGLTLFSDESVDAWVPHWGEDGTIVFSGPTGVHVLPNGGTAAMLSSLNSAGPGVSPFVLPDGSAVLNSGPEGGVTLTDVETDSTRVLVPEGVHPVVLGSGHLLYVGPEGGLFAQPFDPASRELYGAPVRVLDRVGSGVMRRGYSVSEDGSLVVLRGATELELDILPNTRMLHVSRAGETDTVRLPPGPRVEPRFSPSGRSLAFEAPTPPGGTDVHTYDLVTGHEQAITFEGDNDDPIWSPDGERVLFNAESPGEDEDLYVKRVDDPEPKELVLEMPGDQTPLSWSEDDIVLFESRGIETGEDLYWIQLGEDVQPEPFLRSPWDEDDAALSPDGALVAYESNETGRDEIWLRTFPDPSSRWRLSNGVGQEPRWVPDGRGVYFWTFERDSAFLAFVPVEREPRIRPGKLERLSVAMQTGGRHVSWWDVNPDGDRFLVAKPIPREAGLEEDGDGPSGYQVILNWFRELEERLDGGT